jgi:hypothetical protein
MAVRLAKNSSAVTITIAKLTKIVSMAAVKVLKAALEAQLANQKEPVSMDAASGYASLIPTALKKPTVYTACVKSIPRIS